MAVLVRDEFTDTDGTPLSNHSIGPVNAIGAAWSPDEVVITGVATDLFVRGNAAKMPVVGGTRVSGAHLDAGVSDCEITADLTTGTDTGIGGTGLLFWYASAADYWKCDILLGLRITHVVNGSNNNVVTSSAAVSPSTKYAVTLTLDGATVTFATPLGTISYTSATAPTATKHGVTANSVGSSVDNFVLSGELPNAGSIRLSTRTRSRLSLRL